MTTKEHLGISLDWESLTPEDWVINTRLQRRLVAAHLRAVRQQLIEGGVSPLRASRMTRIIRREARYSLAASRPLRPTLRSVRSVARALAVFARSTWASHDTEYYSACGWDDYQDDLRIEARAEAAAMYRAAHALQRRV